MIHLENIFTDVMIRCGAGRENIYSYWHEIQEAYTRKKRYYHNLNHLQHMYTELEQAGNEVKNRDSLLVSLFYHDLVYDVKRKDNEEKSAERCTEVLMQLGVDNSFVDTCSALIMATAAHAVSYNNDMNVFTDADLSILGTHGEKYRMYAAEIRKEYDMYPDLLYNPGRKKILSHFLEMESIFKTQRFIEKYEAQARKNINWEIRHLS